MSNKGKRIVSINDTKVDEVKNITKKIIDDLVEQNEKLKLENELLNIQIEE